MCIQSCGLVVRLMLACHSDIYKGWPEHIVTPTDWIWRATRDGHSPLACGANLPGGLWMASLRPTDFASASATSHSLSQDGPWEYLILCSDTWIHYTSADIQSTVKSTLQTPSSSARRAFAIMSEQQANEAEKNIEIWKVKKLIKRLEAARGNGTSMISLIIRELRRFAKEDSR